MSSQLPKLQKINPYKSKKKKILLLSDDLRMHSGIGTMSKEFVLGTIHKYDWVQLGGAVKHPEEGKVLDMSGEIQKTTNVSDASLKIYACSGYGNPQILNHLIQTEKPDAILHFTDPRFWQWLYQMEHEVRQSIPLMYYNIWDDLPYPYWKNFQSQIGQFNGFRMESMKQISIQLLNCIQHGKNTKNFEIHLNELMMLILFCSGIIEISEGNNQEM